jgi:serine/threonine protein kinase/rhamnogalacturonyl hydrolase YesR
MITAIEKAIYDFRYYLEKYQLSYKESGTYYQVGELATDRGWMLHISIIPFEADRMFSSVIPILKGHSHVYRLVKTREQIHNINLGLYGYAYLGKIITIYLESPGDCSDFIAELLIALKDLRGPFVITDFHIGGTLYAKNGLFSDSNNDPDSFLPQKLPSDTRAPFMQPLHPLPVFAHKRILHGKYVPVDLIKDNLKGNIYKGKFLKGLRFRYCIIKQGLANMISDEAGRDVKDRLLWEKQVCEALSGKVNVPEIYDYFEEKGNGYLVAQFVYGPTFHDLVIELLDRKPWYEAGQQKVEQLLSLTSLLIDSIAAMHHEGFVHRDINPTNFILQDSRLYLVDLELAYSVQNETPLPAFTWGTKGYAAPEQLEYKTPTFKADIYSLGALLIFALTGIEPIFFMERNVVHIRPKLSFAIRHEGLVSLIMQCINRSAEERPSIKLLQRTIREAMEQLHKQPDAFFSHYRQPTLNREDIAIIVNRGIRAVSSYYMTADNIWVSEVKDEGLLEISADTNRKVLPGIYAGISGVLYLMASLQKAGFQVQAAKECITASLSCLLQEYAALPVDMTSPSYFTGSAGIAVGLCKSVEAGFIDRSVQVVQTIYKCFPVTAADCSVTYGKAGQGLALLQCAHIIEEHEYSSWLKQLAAEIIAQQNSNGSWGTMAGDKGPIVYTGFNLGVAGIVYFLLVYSEQFKDAASLQAAEKGLNWLLKQAYSKKGQLSWPISHKNKDSSIWWCDGSAGIALSFLKAYEVTGKEQYKQMADSALLAIPFSYFHHNKTLHHGICGLGEVYLTAYATTGKEEWRQRAQWIAEVVGRLRIQPNEELNFWLMENPEFATADLLVGNGGILHFLARLGHPELKFPLLP